MPMWRLEYSMSWVRISRVQSTVPWTIHLSIWVKTAQGIRWAERFLHVAWGTRNMILILNVVYYSLLYFLPLAAAQKAWSCIQISGTFSMKPHQRNRGAAQILTRVQLLSRDLPNMTLLSWEQLLLTMPVSLNHPLFVKWWCYRRKHEHKWENTPEPLFASICRYQPLHETVIPI
jgi:hypothetical protein